MLSQIIYRHMTTRTSWSKHAHFSYSLHLDLVNLTRLSLFLPCSIPLSSEPSSLPIYLCTCITHQVSLKVYMNHVKRLKSHVIIHSTNHILSSNTHYKLFIMQLETVFINALLYRSASRSSYFLLSVICKITEVHSGLPKQILKLPRYS